MTKIGYGKSKQEIEQLVQNIVVADGRETPFKDGRPGKSWWEGFRRRHPNVSWRKPELIGKERAVLTSEKADKWFEGLNTYLRSEVEGGMDIMKDPTRIFNADELGFPLQAKSEKVLAPKGAKDVYQQSTSCKSQITVLVCASAAGDIIPPLIIHPGVRLHYDAAFGTPEGTSLGRSPSGWIDTEVFFEWVANEFYPWLTKQQVKLPVLLIVDGHSAHINLQTAEFCYEKQIILYCLPPHSTHVLQPLDVAVFRGLKLRWYNALRKFQGIHIGEFVTKASFGKVFGEAWDPPSLSAAAKNGFRRCGIFPFSAEYDKSKLDPSNIYLPESTSTGNSHNSALSTLAVAAACVSRAPVVSDSNSPECSAALPEDSDRATPTSFCSRISSDFLDPMSGFRVLDSALNLSQRALFEKRFEEGYDVGIDPLYRAWKTLKVHVGSSASSYPSTSTRIAPHATKTSSRKSSATGIMSPIASCALTTPTNELSGTPSSVFPSTQTRSTCASATTVTPSRRPTQVTSNSSRSFISPYFTTHLFYPQPVAKSKNPVKKHNMLPKAISGEKWRNYLKEKELKQQEEEKKKQERREEREKRRREKEAKQQEKRKSKQKSDKQSAKQQQQRKEKADKHAAKLQEKRKRKERVDKNAAKQEEKRKRKEKPNKPGNLERS